MVDAASGIVEYLIDTAADEAGSAAGERAAAIQSLGPVVAAAGNPVEIQLYIERIGQRFAITDQQAVKEQLRKGVRAARPAGGTASQAGTHSAVSAPPNPSGQLGQTRVAPPREHVKLPRLQSELLGALLDKPELFSSVYAENLRDLLTAEELQSIFSAAAAQIADQGAPALDTTRLLKEVAGNAALEWLHERLSVETYKDRAEAEEMLRRGLPLLWKQKIEADRNDLAARIRTAREQGNEELAISLTKEWDALARSANEMVKGFKR